MVRGAGMSRQRPISESEKAGNASCRAAPHLTPPEVAARYRVKPDKVLGWIRTGQLRAVNVSDSRRPRWRIAPADLEAFEEKRTATVRAPVPARQPRKSLVGIKEFF